MKKIMQRFLGIAAAAALIVTYAVPVAASSGHTHDGGTAITGTIPDPKYTITLTKPDNVTIADGAVYGAYQIFSGTVKGKLMNGDPIPANPGDKNEKIPITDIKWGNAFGVVDTPEWQVAIVDFVYALATASDNVENEDYAYAFRDFEGFEDFAEKPYNSVSKALADKFYTDPSDKKPENVDFDKLAIEVAEVISNHSDRKWLQQFTDILGGYAKGAGAGYKQDGHVNRYYASKPNDNETPADPKDDKYEITVPAGYYMIRDFSTITADEENSAFSPRLLFVANNITQQLKSDIPTLEKDIIRDDLRSGVTEKKQEWDTEAAGVGDVVTFRLTATLPSDYDNFIGGYIFNFEDTLPTGLTLNENDDYDTKNIGQYVTVRAKGFMVTDNVAGTTTWDPNIEWDILTNSFDSASSSSLTHHHFTTADDKTYTSTLDKQTLTVNFPCLKEIVIEKDGKIYRLGYDTEKDQKSTIYVTYKATVNYQACVDPATKSEKKGNTNRAVLTYSDNPQAYEETDFTTTRSATVYTYGAAITKVDAAEFIKNDRSSVESSLGGAVFALVRKNPDETADENYQIALFNNTSKAGGSFDGKDVYQISSWNNGINGIKVDDIKNLSSAVVEKLKDTRLASCKITSSTDPDTLGALNISGLNDGVTYYLVEVAPPDVDTYATIDPFTLTLTAATENGEYTGLLLDDTDKNDETDGIAIDKGETSSHEITTDHPLSINNFVQIVNEEPVADTNGIAELIVANFKYVDLPSTGGTGTYIFYIIGGVVVAASLVLFFLSRKKTTK